MIDTPEEINAILEFSVEDSSSSIKSSEAEFIYHFLREKGIKRTLETGFAFAKSASHIIAATNSTHVACDPFQENYQNLGLKNIAALGMTDKLDFYPDYSHNLLPALYGEKEFEFIFIDGYHKFDGELIDFYYADLLLANNGYILLHDTWMRSTRLLMSFIRKNRKDFKKIDTPLRNFALYRKVGSDQRNGMHFREFYTLKSILSHNLILFMSSGKETTLKKFLMAVKRMLR